MASRRVKVVGILPSIFEALLITRGSKLQPGLGSQPLNPPRIALPRTIKDPRHNMWGHEELLESHSYTCSFRIHINRDI
jgi:hypothetical protein